MDAAAIDSMLRRHHEREVFWCQHFEFLKSKGYLLRPRYRPGWQPSWGSDGARNYYNYEDAILPAVRLDHLLPSLLSTECSPYQVKNCLDATRVADGQVVWLKHVSKSTPELEIGRLLISDACRNDPRNHTTPLLDVLATEDDPTNVILVFPLLRRISDPSPASVRESIDFIRQTLEVG